MGQSSLESDEGEDNHEICLQYAFLSIEKP